MRTLTIKRRKTVVGCAMPIKLYIKDENAEEIQIEGVPCRKIGQIKNNAQQSFTIDDGETVIYAIADKLTKEYCNDSIVIPAGTEDVTVSGKNHFDLAMGNPFYFDGKTKQERKAKRKKKKGKGLLVLCISVAVGLLVGIPLGRVIGNTMVENANRLDGAAKTFSVQEMQLTLTEDFQQKEQQNFHGCFIAPNVGVMVLREDISMLPEAEAYTPEEYGRLVIEANAIRDAQVKTENGLTYFVFQNTSAENGELYQYLAAVYKSDNALWLVQFGTLPKYMEQYLPQFKQWGQSVSFSAD